MEALDFIDDGTLLFLVLGFLFLVSYWTYKIIREYKGMKVVELPVLTDVITRPYPLPAEPVGMSTEEFVKEDDKEIAAIPYPTPQPTVVVTVTPGTSTVYPMPKG